MSLYRLSVGQSSVIRFSLDFTTFVQGCSFLAQFMQGVAASTILSSYAVHDWCQALTKLKSSCMASLAMADFLDRRQL